MDYNTTVILETERMLFRQHVMADMEPYCAMEQDPEVRKYIGGAPRTREEAEKRFLTAVEPARNRLGLWATIFKAEGSYIGRCGLYPHFREDGGVFEGEASIAYHIATEYWGRGFATEAGKAFVQFGFNELKLERIVTMIRADHAASIRVIKKLGFELTATEAGKWCTFYHFMLQNPDYGS